MRGRAVQKHTYLLNDLNDVHLESPNKLHFNVQYVLQSGGIVPLPASFLHLASSFGGDRTREKLASCDRYMYVF
jgi:hypothetical protein